LHRRKVLISWSSGKDSAWALHQLRRDPKLEVVGLLTTITDQFDRVSMHGVRRALVYRQAQALGLPVWELNIPPDCDDQRYDALMIEAIRRFEDSAISYIAFGDLFLENVRSYRETRLSGTSIHPLFPIWASPEQTPMIARQILEAGIKAIVTTVDPTKLDPSFAARCFDDRFLAELPDGVDPLGENGEFHTFCYSSPDYSSEVDVSRGDIVNRGGFVFADLKPR
jgi:diphthamide synthase (EF-2-diphthine--ammonia ligase)